VLTPTDPRQWVEIVKRRDAFERDGTGFCAAWDAEEKKISLRISSARKRLQGVAVADDMHQKAAQLCMAVKTDGLRGQLTLVRAARALAAFEGRKAVSVGELKRMAAPALRHRLRRNPLDDAGSTARIERAVSEIFGA
jgi:magnesium chelatase subunit I